MKKLTLVIMVAVLLICAVSPVFTIAQNDDSLFDWMFGPLGVAEEANDITVTYNGVEILFDQTVMQNHRVLVPLSTFKETFDAQIYWNDEEQSISFRNIRNGRNLYLAIDRRYAYLEDEGNERQVFDVPPTIINERVFIPVRYFAERFGFDVDWDENTRTVIITKLTHIEGVTAVITYVNNEGVGQPPPPRVFLLSQPVMLDGIFHPRDIHKLDSTFDGWKNPVTGILHSQWEIVNFDSDVILYAAFTNVFTNITVW